MPGIIVYLPQAEVDIEQIAQGIAIQRPRIADRFLNAVDRSLKRLRDLPYLGVPWETEATELQGMRLWVVAGFPNHLVFYRPTASGIEVIRVVHGSRDLDAVFGEG